MIFHTVIGHGDRGGIEGVGFQNIDARVRNPVNFSITSGRVSVSRSLLPLGKRVVDKPITPVVGLF